MRRLSARRGVLLLGELVALSVFGSRELLVLSTTAINTRAIHGALGEGECLPRVAENPSSWKCVGMIRDSQCCSGGERAEP